jgi:hypothetical protein
VVDVQVDVTSLDIEKASSEQTTSVIGDLSTYQLIDISEHKGNVNNPPTIPDKVSYDFLLCTAGGVAGKNADVHYRSETISEDPGVTVTKAAFFTSVGFDDTAQFFVKERETRNGDTVYDLFYTYEQQAGAVTLNLDVYTVEVGPGQLPPPLPSPGNAPVFVKAMQHRSDGVKRVYLYFVLYQ